MPLVDITFDMESDTPPGKDPDQRSPTLRRYHQILWSKPLPSGVRFDLDRSHSGIYLYHRSNVGEQFLSSDGIVHTFQRQLPELVADIPEEERRAFYRLASTIGGYLVFPGFKPPTGMTINQARGTSARVRDRFDLTLECIRRHYLGEASPLMDTLEQANDFLELFVDFRGYVDFFLLNDLVSADYSVVRFMLDFDDFESTDPRPKDLTKYIRYRQASMDFVRSRNARIAEYVNALPRVFEEVRFERPIPPRRSFGTDSLDDAMEAFGLPEKNRQSVRDFVSGRDYDEFYIPPSRAYLGMKIAGTRRADTVHATYLEYRTADGSTAWFGLPEAPANE